MNDDGGRTSVGPSAVVGSGFERGGSLTSSVSEVPPLPRSPAGGRSSVAP